MFRLLTTLSLATCLSSSLWAFAFGPEKPVAPAFTDGHQEYVSVASSSSATLVVWTEYTRAGAGLFGRMINANGDGSSGPLIRLPNRSNTFQKASVATDGRDFLVVWKDGPEVRMARVNSEGLVLDLEGVDLDAPEGGLIVSRTVRLDPAVTFHGTEYHAVWGVGDPGEIRIARISIAGVVQQPIAQVGFSHTLNPALLSNGRQVLLAGEQQYTHQRGTCGGTCFGRSIGVLSLESRGTFSEKGPLTLSRGDWSTQPAIASDGEKFLVAWDELASDFSGDGQNGVASALVSSDGRILNTSIIRSNIGPSTSPDVVWDGSQYVIVWNGNSFYTEAGHLLLRPINADGDSSFEEGAALVASPTFGYYDQPRLTRNDTGLLLFYQRKGTGESFDDPSRIFYRSIAPSPYLILPRPPENVRVSAPNTLGLLVEWDDPNPDTEFVIVELRDSDGLAIDGVTVRVSRGAGRGSAVIRRALPDFSFSVHVRAQSATGLSAYSSAAASTRIRTRR